MGRRRRSAISLRPRRCAAVEDSANGIRAAAAAGMHVVAYPNRHFPPDAEALALAEVVLRELHELPAIVEGF